VGHTRKITHIPNGPLYDRRQSRPEESPTFKVEYWALITASAICGTPHDAGILAPFFGFLAGALG